jgi:uncharacterized membrane protein
MTRNDFIHAFRRGLYGLPPAQIEDLVTDYESHFSEGIAAGRSEEEIAAALGDPARLAREQRAEAGFKRWESEGTPGSLAGVVLALAGLATVDIMLLFPVLLPLAAIFLGLGAASFGMFVGGIALSMVSVFPGLAWFGLSGNFAGALALGLAGIGLIAGGIGLGALVWLTLHLAARLLVRYARLHFQLINAVSV